MATTPTYAVTPKIGIFNIVTANTGRDGTGTIETVFTAGASGSRIERVTVTARVSTTAGAVRLWIHNGTTAFLFEELAVGAVTASATVNAWTGDSVKISATKPLFLPTGYSLRASTEIANNFNVIAIGADL